MLLETRKGLILDHDLLIRLATETEDAESLEDLARPLLEIIHAVTNLESTYLTTVNELEGIQRILYSKNRSTLEIPEGLSVPWHDTLCKRAMEEGRPYTDDVSTCWGDSEAAKQLGIKTYLSQPIHDADGQLFGTLCAASGRSVSVGPNTLPILALFTRLLAQQVAREARMEELRRANTELLKNSLSDPLTGIGNRRAMDHELKRMLAQSARSGQRVQVGFIDLDGFKAINDQHGHDTGDRFLIKMAERLGQCVRSSDIVARVGGDEFVVLAPGNEPDELEKRLFEQTIFRFEIDDGSIDYSGASVGVVCSDENEIDPAALLERADAKMYSVKNRRRALAKKAH